MKLIYKLVRLLLIKNRTKILSSVEKLKQQINLPN